MNQRCLFLCRPCAVARPRTVTKSRTIEGQDAVIRAKTIEKAGGLEIFGRRAIAMEKDYRCPFASIEVMQPNT